MRRPGSPNPPHRSDPGRIFVANNLAQQEFFRDTESLELLYSGFYGSSKTRTLTEKADYYCRRVPRLPVVLARKKREHMGATTLPVLLNETILPGERDGWWKVSADGGSRLEYPNGSSILCVGLDNPGRLRSGAFALALVDQAEELDEDECEGILGRLRWMEAPFRQLGMACNPDSPSHYLFTRFALERAEPGELEVRTVAGSDIQLENGETFAGGKTLRRCIFAQPGDNLENMPTSYLVWRATAHGRYKDRYVLGRWVAFEGLVYDRFRRSVHVVPRPVAWDEWGGHPPPDWKRGRGIDFGYVNPFNCQWWARDPSDNWWLYREIYHSHRLVSDHAEQMRRLEADELAALNRGRQRRAEAEDGKYEPLRRLPIRWSYADHDAEDRATLDRLGIATAPANKDIGPGIQTVYALMAVHETPAGLRSRLRIVRGACVEHDPWLESQRAPTCTADELPLYKYPRAQATMASGEKSLREDPVKVKDHGCDAMRYLHHSRITDGGFGVERLNVLAQRADE